MNGVRRIALPALGLGLLFVAAQAGPPDVTACKELAKEMNAAKVSLWSAFAAAEKYAKGQPTSGTALFEDEELRFNVDCLVGERILVVSVDRTGKATKMDEAPIKPEEASNQRSIARRIEAEKVAFESVIKAAEKHADGRALAAYSEIKDGELIFNIYCLAEDKIQRVDVDKAAKPIKMEEVKRLPEREKEPEPRHGD